MDKYIFETVPDGAKLRCMRDVGKYKENEVYEMCDEIRQIEDGHNLFHMAVDFKNIAPVEAIMEMAEDLLSMTRDRAKFIEDESLENYDLHEELKMLNKFNTECMSLLKLYKTGA